MAEIRSKIACIKKTSSGFTIVELLIVIVVIAILAAITIVAFNGIQTRAENTKTTNAVAAYAKALKLYATDTGLYPQYNYPCLNGVSPCSNITDTTSLCSGYGRTTAIASFDAALATVTSALPSVSNQQMDCNGKMYSGAFYTYTNSGKNSNIIFFLKGSTSCPSIAGSTPSMYQNSNTTACNVALPALP